MVKDMDKSVAFYQSIGFDLQQRWQNYYAQLAAPGVTIGLHPSETTSPSGSGSISIGFSVENIEEAKSLLQNLTINATERNEEGGQFLHFTDPDGTELYFIKPKW
jgi:predicted enzyme related to lactoylglutathione lyase